MQSVREILIEMVESGHYHAAGCKAAEDYGINEECDCGLKEENARPVFEGN